MMQLKTILSAVILGAALLGASDARAQGADPPHIMILFDTSGSMLYDLGGTLTGGDGSHVADPSHYPWGTDCCPGLDMDGDGEANDSRIFIAKDVIQEAVWSVGVGEVVFGLSTYWMRYHEGWDYCSNNDVNYFGHETTTAGTECTNTISRPGPDPREDRTTWQGANCAAGGDGGMVFVRYDPSDVYRDYFLSFLDGDEDTTGADADWPENPAANPPANPEIRAVWATPLSGAIYDVADYFDTWFPAHGEPCQQFAVILTDGAQSGNCSGDPVAAVTALASHGVTVYVIAFTISDADDLATMDNMAAAGGTDYARLAGSRDQLRAAFAEIIEAAVQVETCDGADNDCDGEIDEELYRPCSTICGGGQETCSFGTWGSCSAPTPSPESCNNIDDDCDGSVDEDLTRDCTNSCGPGTETCLRGVWGGCTAPQGSLEVCDGVDNDCDTDIDEDDPLLDEACGSDTGACTTGVWQCVAGELVCSGTNPVAETCNDIDDDCDGSIDEGLSRSCDYNAFCPGTEICVAGAWTGCTAPTDPLPDETCDGIDNDCDGETDEGLTLACSTVCGDGVRTCAGGVWGACDAPTPSEEVCDGTDNDCDGEIDENVLRPCTYLSCTGWEQCVGPDTWDNCTAVPADPTELCDGIDNDCDGVVDDGVTRPCTTACGTGTQVCADGSWGACDAREPAPEVCDGEDNDCDGETDEGLTRACSLLSCTGQEHCEDGAWVGCTAEIQTEICDGIDNDCDGTPDDGLTRACHTDCGDGVETCTDGAWAGCTAPTPTPETCDGIDNDCDGLTDENVTRACTVGTCSGVQSCTGADTWSECVVSSRPEVCDGEDNDCDGAVDETDAGDPLVRACSSVCGLGTQTCTAGAWSACTAPLPDAEVCDGLDNDCNGLVDDGLVRDCSTACGDGTETCVDGFWAPCTAAVPTDEVCDGEDNDCDGETDEDDPDLLEECGTDEGVCELGFYDCVGGVLECVDDVEPTEEICDGLDNDCDGTVDEGLPLGEVCDDDTGLGDTGQCEWGHWVCSAGALVCEGYVGPTTERCDCLDNDCDGLIDEGLGLGGDCGTDVGECSMGSIQCYECEEVCVGDIGPVAEVCDLLDNDCDGEIDEPADEICPAEGAICIEGECVLPCGDGEFPCPPDRVCREVDGTGYCFRNPCASVNCDPCSRCDTMTGECVEMCDGVTCGEGEQCVCEDDAVRCVPADCYHLGCEEGQRCVGGACEDDPCAGQTCGDDQFCRDGDCVDMCVEGCGAGQICVDGACQPDPCAGAECPDGARCDTATGECSDLCADVECPTGRVCDLATGDCVDDPCLVVTCPDGARCEDGLCVREGGGEDAGADGGADGGPSGAPVRVLATGGGGCTCSTTSTGGGSAVPFLFALLGLLALRRGRT